MLRKKDTEGMKPLRTRTSTGGKHAVDDDTRGLDKGWSWVVLFASFGAFCLIGSTMYSVGIIHSTLLERYRENVALTSWVGAIHSALISAGGPLSSAVIDRISCRMAIVLSGLCYIVGYFTTAFAPNIYVALFTCGIIGGIGGAFGYTACIVVVGFNFQRHRNFSLGIALSGVGMGMFVLAPLMQMSRTYYGSSGFFIVLAAMAANIVVFGVLCFPSHLELSAHRKRKLERRVRTDEKSVRCVTLRSYVKVVLNKPVLCLCLAMLNYCLGTFLIYLHLPTYIEHKGFTPTEASYVLSVSGVLNVVGRVLTGMVANIPNLPHIALYSGSMALISLATFTLPLISEYYVGNMVYAVILGLFLGSCYVVITSVTVQYVGIQYMACAIGMQMFFGGVGALAGPVLAGMIVDAGGSYDQSFIVAASCILLGSILGVVSSFLKSEEPPDPREQEINIDENMKEIITSKNSICLNGLEKELMIGSNGSISNNFANHAV